MLSTGTGPGTLLHRCHGCVDVWSRVENGDVYRHLLTLVNWDRANDVFLWYSDKEKHKTLNI